MRIFLSLFIVAGIVVRSAPAAAAPDPALTCETGKLKVAAKYGTCRLDQEAKAVKIGGQPDFTKCAETFSKKWQGAETKATEAGGLCVDAGNESAIGRRVVNHTTAIATLLSGTTLSFVDNGDGTVTDGNSGLMWEKKAACTGAHTECTDELGTCANPHHGANEYTWSASGGLYNGSLTTILLPQLNDRCNLTPATACTTDADCPADVCGFAGHRDWRIPTKKELEGLLDTSTMIPALASAFQGAMAGPGCTDVTNPACSCDPSGEFWSATPFVGAATHAWFISTFDGSNLYNPKTDSLYARAVRGGA